MGVDPYIRVYAVSAADAGYFGLHRLAHDSDLIKFCRGASRGCSGAGNTLGCPLPGARGQRTQFGSGGSRGDGREAYVRSVFLHCSNHHGCLHLSGCGWDKTGYRLWLDDDCWDCRGVFGQFYLGTGFDHGVA